MGQTVKFTVPGQPQGKGRPRVGKVGNHARLFTPQKTVAYEGLVAHAASLAMRAASLRPLSGPLTLHLVIRCQVPQSWSLKKQRQALGGVVLPTTKPDTDNVLKAISDACNGVVWGDDVQVVDTIMSKRYHATPGVVVTVSTMDEGAWQGSLLEAAA